MARAAAVDVPSTDITWESTEVMNVGLDIGLFSNKLTFTADYYVKRNV